MNTIKISETKLKVMLSADDMESFHIRSADVDYTDPEVREALRTLLREAGRGVGFDTDRGRAFIQLYPDRRGGCELFLTLLDGKMSAKVTESKDTYADTEKEREGEEQMPTKSTAASSPIAARYKYTVNIFEFSELSSLLSVCKRLSERMGGSESTGESAAFSEAEKGAYFLIVYESGRSTSFDSVEMICGEYGGVRRKSSAYAYIKEHCTPICETGAVMCLGALA